MYAALLSLPLHHSPPCFSETRSPPSPPNCFHLSGPVSLFDPPPPAHGVVQSGHIDGNERLGKSNMTLIDSQKGNCSDCIAVGRNM